MRLRLECAVVLFLCGCLGTPAFSQGRVVGRILDEETLSPLQAEIALSLRTTGGLEFRHVRAREDGVFVAEDLDADEVHLTTKMSGYAAEHLTVNVGDRETTPVELVLSKAATVRGLVLDELSRPVEGARVALAYRNRGVPSKIRAQYQWETGNMITDAHGQFEVREVPFGRDFIVTASHPDFAISQSSGFPLSKHSPAPSVILTLSKGVRITGQVKDTSGNPVPRVPVRLFDAEKKPASGDLDSVELLQESRRITVTGDDGTFVFEGVGRVTRELIVHAAEYKPLRMVVDLTAATQTDVTLEVTLTNKR
jgi:protocatechuate 3,4-dioxygenase beta subunit